jgi:hypothetical protein
MRSKRRIRGVRDAGRRHIQQIRIATVGGLRASTVIHISNYIDRLMQCHIRFLWCGGERAKREKEVVVSPNNHLINKTNTSWDNSTTIVWVVVMQLIIFLFYVHKLRNYIDQTTHYKDCLLSRPKITCKYMRRPIRPHQCTCPKSISKCRTRFDQKHRLYSCVWVYIYRVQRCCRSY